MESGSYQGVKRSPLKAVVLLLEKIYEEIGETNYHLTTLIDDVDTLEYLQEEQLAQNNTIIDLLFTIRQRLDGETSYTGIKSVGQSLIEIRDATRATPGLGATLYSACQVNLTNISNNTSDIRDQTDKLHFNVTNQLKVTEIP